MRSVTRNRFPIRKTAYVFNSVIFVVTSRPSLASYKRVSMTLRSGGPGLHFLYITLNVHKLMSGNCFSLHLRKAFEKTFGGTELEDGAK